jgi:hypothetical protein
MLWYKAWLDTRWRFLIGLAVLLCTALANALGYSSVPGVLKTALDSGLDSWLTREFDWVTQLSGSFRGFVWANLVRLNLLYPLIIFAVLMGADGTLSRRNGVVFTLSLPVSRRRLCAVRAATDLLELLLLALIPMLAIAVAAPIVGQAYAFADVLVYSISLFVGGAVFYALALLLATAFDDRWRAVLLTFAVAIATEVGAGFVPALARLSPAAVMAAEGYFRTGTPSWSGLLLWLAVSIVMFFAAVRSIERRDY